MKNEITGISITALIAFSVGLSIGYSIKKTNPYPDWSYCNGMEDRFTRFIHEDTKVRAVYMQCCMDLQESKEKEKTK